MQRTLLPVCCLLLGFFAGPAALGGMVGQQLPEMRLDFLGSAPDYKKKPMLLEFWATWCPPCRESIPHVNEIYGKYKDRGLVVIGVTAEPGTVIRRFQKDVPMNYAVATDQGGRLSEKMGINGIPHAFLISESGEIVWEGHPGRLEDRDIEKILGAPSGGQSEARETPAAVEESGSAAANPEAVAAPEAPAENTPSGGDAAVLSAEDIASMEAKVGTEVVVEGTVQGVGTGSNGSITFINFGERRAGFVAVVFRAAYGLFPEGFDKYAHQKVRVRGTLEKYQDRQMQIKISTPDQLEIVTDAP